jgi:hypothetical protein
MKKAGQDAPTEEGMSKAKRLRLTRAAPYPSDKHKRLASLLGEALLYTANEPVLLARSEEFFSPKPANLKIDRPLGQRLNKLIEQIGGIPRLIVYEPGGKLPQFDTYGNAAIQEVISSFERCRRSVCRTHVCFIAAELCKKEPSVFENLKRQEQKGLTAQMSEVFWEHAETSYIRLASYWDRVGQFLDFVFFNIRQYERDGFPSVMDRIASNYVRLFGDLASSSFWTALRSYQNSEKPTGFQWLLRRRNLLVHSLHLEGIQSAEGEENPIFTSAYNHLEDSVHRKLKPDTCETELGFLHSHLRSAADLFPLVVDLCEHCAALTRRDIVKHLSGS